MILLVESFFYKTIYQHIKERLKLFLVKCYILNFWSGSYDNIKYEMNIKTERTDKQ